MVLYYLPEENMETILDTKSLKIYSEIIDKYTIYYNIIILLTSCLYIDKYY